MEVQLAQPAAGMELVKTGAVGASATPIDGTGAGVGDADVGGQCEPAGIYRNG